MNGCPIASMHALEEGLRKHGPPNTTPVLFEELMDSKAIWLTPNTTSVYMASASAGSLLFCQFRLQPSQPECKDDHRDTRNDGKQTQ